MYKYEAQMGDELSLRVGDIIRSVSMSQGMWWYGKLGSRSGVFPKGHVQVVEKLDSHIKSRSSKYRVVYPYQPVRVDELELIPGQLVEMLGEEEPAWWRGKCGDRLGVFPSEFVCGPFNSTYYDEDSRDLNDWFEFVDQTPPSPAPRLFKHRVEVLSPPVVFKRRIPISASLFDPEDEPCVLFDIRLSINNLNTSDITSDLMESSRTSKKLGGILSKIKTSFDEKPRLKRFLSSGSLFSVGSNDCCSPIMTKRRNTVSEYEKMKSKSSSSNHCQAYEKYNDDASRSEKYKSASGIRPLPFTPELGHPRNSSLHFDSFDLSNSHQNLASSSCQEKASRDSKDLENIDVELAGSARSKRMLLRSDDSGVGGCDMNNLDESFIPEDIAIDVFDNTQNSKQINHTTLSAKKRVTKALHTQIRTSYSTTQFVKLSSRRNLVSTNPAVFWNCSKEN